MFVFSLPPLFPELIICLKDSKDYFKMHISEILKCQNGPCHRNAPDEIREMGKTNHKKKERTKKETKNVSS